MLGSILEHIGNTPMVRLNKIPQAEGLECEVCTSPRRARAEAGEGGEGESADSSAGDADAGRASIC